MAQRAKYRTYFVKAGSNQLTHPILSAPWFQTGLSTHPYARHALLSHPVRAFAKALIKSGKVESQEKLTFFENPNLGDANNQCYLEPNIFKPNPKVIAVLTRLLLKLACHRHLEPFNLKYILQAQNKRFIKEISNSTDHYIGSHISLKLASEVKSSIEAIDNGSDREKIIESLIDSIGNEIKNTYDNRFVGQYAKTI